MKKSGLLLLLVVLSLSTVTSTSFAWGWNKKKVAANLRIRTETDDHSDLAYSEGPLGPSCVTDISSIDYDYPIATGYSTSYFCRIQYFARSRDPQKKLHERRIYENVGVYLQGDPRNFSLGPDFDFGIFNVFTGGITEIFIQTPLNAIKGDIERGVNNYRSSKRAPVNLVQPMALLLCDIEVARLSRRACPEATYIKGQYDNRVSAAYGAFLGSMGVTPSVPLR